MFDDERLDWPTDTLGYQAAMLNLAMLRVEATLLVALGRPLRPWVRRAAWWVKRRAARGAARVARRNLARH